MRSSLINYDKKGTDVKQQQSGTNNDENALFALRSGHRYGSFSSSRIEVYVFLKRIAKNTGTVDLGGGKACLLVPLHYCRKVLHEAHQ